MSIRVSVYELILLKPARESHDLWNSIHRRDLAFFTRFITHLVGHEMHIPADHRWGAPGIRVG